MAEHKPRFSAEWEALAIVAGKLAEARADRPDAAIWKIIAADWQWVLTHQGEPAFGQNQAARIACTAAAAERARKQLPEVGIGDPSMLHYSDRIALPDRTLAFLEKYELLAAIAWHEARITPSGRPMIALVTEINIQWGRGPRGTGAILTDLDDKAAETLPTPAAPAPAVQTPLPSRRPPAAPQPQQARLI